MGIVSGLLRRRAEGGPHDSDSSLGEPKRLFGVRQSSLQEAPSTRECSTVDLLGPPKAKPRRSPPEGTGLDLDMEKKLQKQTRKLETLSFKGQIGCTV